MRVRSFVGLGLFVVIVGACSAGSPTATSVSSSGASQAISTGASPTLSQTANPTVSVTATPAALKSVDVVQALAAAGLEAGSPSVMTIKDYGIAPHRTDDATHFLLPSVCSDCGGRAFVFSSLDDLRAMKDYYDSLGKSSAMLFSWTYANEGKLVLVQLNGDLPKDKAEKYGAVVAGL